MSDKRSHRVGPRTGQQILDHPEDVYLLQRIARGEVANSPALRMDLRRLARDELILVGFAAGSVPTMQPRSLRVLAVVSGEIPAESDEW